MDNIKYSFDVFEFEKNEVCLVKIVKKTIFKCWIKCKFEIDNFNFWWILIAFLLSNRTIKFLILIRLNLFEIKY